MRLGGMACRTMIKIIAGLQVLGIIDEPIAAAIASGLDKKGGESLIIVYDLRGERWRCPASARFYPPPRATAPRAIYRHIRTRSPGPYREEDVLLSLQLLAYLTKYPHVRQAFYKPRAVFNPTLQVCSSAVFVLSYLFGFDTATAPIFALRVEGSALCSSHSVGVADTVC